MACLVDMGGRELLLQGGVELGKDEAAYWYWSQHLDASYALVPFTFTAVAHALWPGAEWALRLNPFVAERWVLSMEASEGFAPQVQTLFLFDCFLWQVGHSANIDITSPPFKC